MEKTEKETALTQKEFKEFLSATEEERWRILLDHSQKNEKLINQKKLKAECAESGNKGKAEGKTE